MYLNTFKKCVDFTKLWITLWCQIENDERLVIQFGEILFQGHEILCKISFAWNYLELCDCFWGGRAET